MKNAPTILQVIPWLDSGGVERGTVDIAKAIIDAGGKALVASERGRLSADLEEMGGVQLEFEGRTKNPFKILHSHAKQIEKMIKEQGVDLVHARSRAPAWSAYLAARRAGVPFVTTYHGAYSQKGRFKAFYNSVMAKGDVVIANSGYTRDLVAGRNPDAKDRLTVIYRGVDLEKFDPAVISKERIQALRSKWGLAERPVLLLPSRLTRWKGQAFILPVLGVLKKQGLSFQVALIGDDQGRQSYVEELDALTLAHGLQDMVKRVGHCADMPAAYALADVTIVPSQDAETFGRSAAESLAMQTPVLVGDLGAQPEVVAAPEGFEGDSWLGQSLTHGDEKAWQDALVKSLTSKADKTSEQAIKARDHVAKTFSLQSMGQQTMAVYDQLIGSTLVAKE
ncbi:glycosyltransferase family 4 protein [Cohaesibacter gelatinilyticus]|uniref:Glycosyltransferase involved in cell wall bisynthesis n=1 Tax=Cohaesibacter gelatinilyticus TaxID=372072 RepID=A0A285PE60_9HYPH|nr:glycosyltransferase family 4 protein [Cohaesibacter gelatinilyticus]SNZ20044.1 Glycosyltransferase involved in cell wall bisynthesis [Cohaesibacter gelatinilyticus]